MFNNVNNLMTALLDQRLITSYYYNYYYDYLRMKDKTFFVTVYLLKFGEQCIFKNNSMSF